MLTGIHILLTLKCTNECDHCFLHCGPSREATFTLGQLQALIRQIEQLGTVTVVYFEGGESRISLDEFTMRRPSNSKG